MKHNEENPGKILDRAIGELRQASASPEQVERASAQVLQRLHAEYNKVVPHPSMGTSDASASDRIQGCADFRALIPAYLTSSLTPARRLLFEDHVRECVGCRKALEAAKRGWKESSAARVVSGRRIQARHIRWAGAIAAVLMVAVAMQTTPVRDWLWPIDVHAVVQSIDGGLFNVSGQDVRPMKSGQRVDRDQPVRTGASSGAMLELADGTRVEMAPRSELSLGRARDGVKIQLARGNVIVKAAKQHGHLYVQTTDCTVSVVGTVFSVHSGIKGSRVGVIEGLVRVRQQDGAEQALNPGDQVVTNPEMGTVSFAQEIGWSRNAEEWLKELTSFGQDMAKRTENLAMRYTSNLVPLAPSDTLVLAAFPNVSQPFKESYALFRQRLAENSTLANWWNKADHPSSGMRLDEIADYIAEVGSYLGPEVVLAFPKDMMGKQPVLLAEASQPEALVSALEGDLRRMRDTGGSLDVRLARNAGELAAASGATIVIYVENGLMVISDPGQVARTAAFHRKTVSNTFAGTPLYQRLEQAYREGVGWLLAVDLQQLVKPGDLGVKQIGFENVQQLVLEQKTGVGNAASRVTLGFNQERRGLATWLGAPAPMGALDFVSPDAYGFSAWVVKDPELILDDIFNLVQDNPQALQHLRELQESHGIDLRRDLAEPLGNEVLIALDGPVLPTPSWKVVLEVNNGPRLENAIQWAITNVNRELEARQLPTWSLESETVDGKTYHALTSKGSAIQIHYTSWTGYMILSSSRALLTEAIRIHDSGNSISRSAAFRAQMPPDGRDIASGIMYQNVESMARALPAGATDAVAQGLQDELRQAALVQASVPKLALVYGEQDRIQGTAKGSFGINIASMFGLNGIIHAAGFGSPTN